MLMKTRILWVMAALVLLSGCDKLGRPGSAIKFRAVTVYDEDGTKAGDPSTKTAYSGVVTSNFERIDWVAGDEIRIRSNVAQTEGGDYYADYTLGTITASGSNSASKATPDGGHGLLWGDGTHDFWAAYPSTATVGDHTITSNIPATQTLTYKTKSNNTLIYAPDMSKALMVAGLQTDPVDGINLDFYPAYTAFDFTVLGNTTIVVDEFTMETTTSGEVTKKDLSGDATVTFGASMARSYYATGTTGQSVTTTFSPTAAISTTTSLNFKLFAVPCDIKGVTITFHITVPTDQTLSLRLKYAGAGGWLEFDACKKYNISGLLEPGAEWTITMDGPRVEQWTIVPEVVFGVE